MIKTSTFLSSRELLCTYQSCFQQKHSKDVCLSYLDNRILKGFEKGMMTSMIMIDLQTAFDAVDHTFAYFICHWLLEKYC